MRSKASWTNCEINSRTLNNFNPVRVMPSIVDSFDELPQALVKARIALRLSQKDLADRPGMKEQQIQRYESTDYQSASMSRLLDDVQALLSESVP